MVCLNTFVSFNKIKLKNNLKVNLNEYIKLEIPELSPKMIFKINNKINNKLDNLFSDDNFIFINMNDNLCGHKYKKGKQEGHFCCKKITVNGDKSNYVCTKHNKNHIPKKRIKKGIKNTTKSISNSTVNTIINNNIIRFFKNNNRNRILKRNKKTFICNGGIINLGNILNKLLT